MLLHSSGHSRSLTFGENTKGGDDEDEEGGTKRGGEPEPCCPDICGRM